MNKNGVSHELRQMLGFSANDEHALKEWSRAFGCKRRT